MKQQTRGCLMLMLCAVIWGSSFVAQSEGMNYIGPFTMQATRYFLSGLVLLPVIYFRDKKGVSVRPAGGKAAKRQLLCGIVCGVILCMASLIQQYGIIYTTVGKSGFITTMYIILVPFLGLFIKLRVKLKNWLCAFVAVAGLYLLAGSEGLSNVNVGDWLTLLCAFFFAIHILFIDRACHDLDGVRLSCTQFFTASVVSILPMLIFEKPSVSEIAAAWLPIIYAGVMSGGVGYTLQILGQQKVQPTLASMILSLESVFAALFGWVLLHQALSARELVGCAVIFAAIILAQLPEKKAKTA